MARRRCPEGCLRVREPEEPWSFWPPTVITTVDDLTAHVRANWFVVGTALGLGLGYALFKPSTPGAP